MKGRELEQIGQINAIASGKIFRSNTLIWIKEKFHGIGIFAMTIKEFFCFPAQIAHLPIGKEIPRKMIFINIIHHLLNPFT